MNTLDSPLEALALNYLSYGFLTAVNSIWAWIAIVTAAVSFWKIKASSSSKPEPLYWSQGGASTSSLAVQDAVVLSSPPTTKSPCVLERELSTKVKFTLHYNQDNFRESDDGGDNDGGVAAVREKLWWWCDDLDRKIDARMWDMGWYRCQDLTALDGSVVRLWDGCKRRYDAALLVDGGAMWFGEIGRE